MPIEEIHDYLGKKICFLQIYPASEYHSIQYPFFIPIQLPQPSWIKLRNHR